MKILLVGNYLPDKQESMLRFGELLLDLLSGYGQDVTLVRPEVVFNRSQASFEERGKWWGYVDKFLLFPFRLRWAIRSANIVHVCDHSNAFYVHFIESKPHVINCHDIIAIKSALDSKNATQKKSGKILQSAILHGLKKAKKIACISQNTREELTETANISTSKSVVIYMGLNYPFKKMDDDEANKKTTGINEKLNFPFVLHVGGNQPYKNRMGVLRIYHEFLSIAKSAPPLLVLAGKPWSDEMRTYIVANNLGEKVIEIQGCSNEEIRALYSVAKAFIFPSLAEGFGWPIIEAQACGCPTLISNFAPLTEVGGNAALYCDPNDEIEAAQLLKQLLDESKIEKEKRVDEGLKNIQRFDPKNMIESYLDLYRTAIDNYHSKT